MNRITRLVVAALVLFTVGCAAQTPELPEQKAEATELSRPVSPDDARVVGFQRELDELKKHDEPGVLELARQSKACGRYDHLIKYEELGKKWEEATIVHPDFAKALATATQAQAERTAGSAYHVLKTFGKLDCGGTERTESAVIEQFATMFDKYKVVLTQNPNERGAEHLVIRDAYLRAVKVEIKEALAELERTGDAGNLFEVVQGAMDQWHFSLRELEVPEATWKKIKDSDRG